MNKFYSIFIVLFLIIFTACSSKESMKYFNKDKFHAKSIQYTKKVDINENSEVKYMFFLTYLNGVDESYKNNKIDSFIVGFHDIDKKDSDLLNSGFNIKSRVLETIKKINGKEITEIESIKPIKIIKLEKDSNLVENISLKNSWASYYLVKFNATKNSKITLDIKNSKYIIEPIIFKK